MSNNKSHAKSAASVCLFVPSSLKIKWNKKQSTEKPKRFVHDETLTTTGSLEYLN